ncbi:hypothetical protein D3C76_1506780 [compost metagenome]
MACTVWILLQAPMQRPQRMHFSESRTMDAEEWSMPTLDFAPSKRMERTFRSLDTDCSSLSSLRLQVVHSRLWSESRSSTTVLRAFRTFLVLV